MKAASTNTGNVSPDGARASQICRNNSPPFPSKSARTNRVGVTNRIVTGSRLDPELNGRRVMAGGC
jgi:hypothetical protein